MSWFSKRFGWRDPEQVEGPRTKALPGGRSEDELEKITVSVGRPERKLLFGGKPGQVEGEYMPPSREEREAALKQEEASKYREKLEKERAKAELEGIQRKSRADELKLEVEQNRSRFEKSRLAAERRGRIRGEVGSYVKGAGTYAGGLMQAVVPKGQKTKLISHRDFYLPTKEAAKKIYVSTEGTKVLRESTSIPYESLRKSTQLGQETSPSLARMVMPGRMQATPGSPLKSAIDYGFLRSVGTPKGLSKIEQAAYSTVAATPERDTAQSVVGTLTREGFGRKQARSAIETLVLRGFLQETQEAPGERKLLEVAR